jgi:hypothetical protein
VFKIGHADGCPEVVYRGYLHENIGYYPDFDLVADMHPVLAGIPDPRSLISDLSGKKRGTE